MAYGVCLLRCAIICVCYFTLYSYGKKVQIDVEKIVGKRIVIDCYNDCSEELNDIFEVYDVQTVEEHIAEYAKKINDIAYNI